MQQKEELEELHGFFYPGVFFCWSFENWEQFYTELRVNNTVRFGKARANVLQRRGCFSFRCWQRSGMQERDKTQLDSLLHWPLSQQPWPHFEMSREGVPFCLFSVLFLPLNHSFFPTPVLQRTLPLTLIPSLLHRQIDQLLGSVIEMWVDRMDNITQPERRKLSSLALLSLLPSENRWGYLQYVCRSVSPKYPHGPVVPGELR